MAKIDFSKVEQSLGEAMHHFFIKKLVDGHFTGNARAISYLGQQRSKPGPQDSVIECLVDIRSEEEEEAKKEQELAFGTLPEKATQAEPEISQEEQSTPFVPPPEEPMMADEEKPTIAPIFILRNRIRWFIKKRVTNVYQLLGTTKEEVSALRRKTTLSDSEQARITELIAKSSELHQLLNKKLGVGDNEALIASEKKKHRTKRFNVRETWLPL
jgi:hypothetical protein